MVYAKFFQCGKVLGGMEIANSISNNHVVFENLHTLAIIIGGTFVLIALLLSTLLILQHLRSYTKPEEQKWVIGVLLMVPIYATESIISLGNARFSMVCDILRNCYEAFALYCFGNYLVACLGGEECVLELLENGAKKQLNEPLLEGEDTKETPILSLWHDFFFHPSVLGKRLYVIIKFGIVQYMILKTACAFLALFLELFGVYGDGKFQWNYGYPYIAVVINFSQMWALYCLVQFYNVAHRRLQAIKPLAKFISFKAIVFATWWQGVGIALLCHLGVLPKPENVRNGIQDFLICIEMAIAAVAHVFVFSATPYRFLPVYGLDKVVTQATTTKVQVKGHDEEKPSAIEQVEAHVKAPGTSITESVQDVVVGGGEHVVKDVVLTISQAVEPVEKGVTKIQDTFHHMKLKSKDEEEGPEVELEEQIEEDIILGGQATVTSKEEVLAEHSSGS